MNPLRVMVYRSAAVAWPLLTCVLLCTACDALDSAPADRDDSATAGRAGDAARELPDLPDLPDNPDVPDGAVGPVGFRSITPAGNFGMACDADADCDEPYMCLQSRAFGSLVPDSLCSLPCGAAQDCPVVFNEHCGDLTACDNGVCGSLGCQ